MPMTTSYNPNYSYLTSLLSSLHRNFGKPFMNLMSNPKLSFLDLPWKPYYTQLGMNVQLEPFNWFEHEKSLEVLALAMTIFVTVLLYSFEHWLDERQRRIYSSREFPKDLEEVVREIDKETRDKEDDNDKEEKKLILTQLQAKFEKSQNYSLDKLSFGILHDFYTTIETIVFILLGALPYTWDTAISLIQKYYRSSKTQIAFFDSISYETHNEIIITLVFFTLTTFLGTVTSLPWDYYSTFHIEKKHGFNKQTLKLFVTDRIKSLFLTFLIGCPVLAIVISLIHWGGEYFYIYVWIFTFLFSSFMMMIVPIWIMPLFNKYTSLEEGELKDKTYELAKKLNYPLKKLLVIDGSKRSSHSNAFMYGFGSNKRIVLFDTLFGNVNTDEIVSILGHELGHWKLGHSLFNFMLSQVYFGIIFYCFSLCYHNTGLYAAFGFNDPNRPIPTIIALTLFFQTLWAPMDKVVSFATTLHSRKCEFQADKFSTDLNMGSELQRGLVKISMENLGAMVTDKWYAMYHYSHPPLVQRIQAIRENMKIMDLQMKKQK